MNTFDLSDDAMGILMICGEFGKSSETNVRPLSLKEYNKLAFWLKNNGFTPNDLIKGKAIDTLDHEPGIINISRLEQLLARGASVAFAIERWTNKGIWIVCRSDNAYPKRLRHHLGLQAPPILYGVGNQELVDGGGLAVVGSRNVDEAGANFTAKASARAVEQGISVISGGARGVDQIAMQSAFDADGLVVGVLGDGLLKKSLKPEMRESIKSRRLSLLSPFHPETGWKVYNAMNRNKIIYALSDYALVISAEYKKGGTWQGAEEELRRDNSVPVFVRMDGEVPKGNHELSKKGGIPLTKQLLRLPFTEILSQVDVKKSEQPNLPGFDFEENLGQTISDQPCKPELEDPSNAEIPKSIFEAVLPIIIKSLSTPKTSDDLVKELDLKKGQLDQWLKEAEKRDEVRKLTKPVRYIATINANEDQLIK